MVFIELIASIFECFVITESTSKCLRFKNNHYIYLKYILYTAAMLFINLFLPYITNSNIIPGASQIIVTFVFGMLFMQGSAFFTLFVATLSNIGLIVINVSVMTAFSYFTQWDLNELIVNQTSTRILLLFITKFLYFLYTRLMLKFFEREKYPLSANDWYIIISLLTISLLFTLIVFSINLHKMFNPTLIVITTSLVVIINIAMYIIIYLQVRNHLSDNRIKIYEDYKAATEIEIKEITEKNNKMRKIKHELKNSGIQIQKLISQGKLEDAEKMIASITNVNLGEDTQYVKLKHNMLETIINNKLTVCGRENIDIQTYDVSDIETELYGISEQEMCTIISNLLDNAIESCIKYNGDKFISLKILHEKEYILINVINTTSKTKVNYNGSALKTSKEDKENHGLGTQIINDIAYKYNGNVKYEIVDNQFIANVMLECVKTTV